MASAPAISLTLLNTLDKLASSPRSSVASTTGLASPETSGTSTAQSDHEWQADSSDELEELDSAFDLSIIEQPSSRQLSFEPLSSPAAGPASSPALSALLSPAPGLAPTPAFWPATPEFTPLTGPVDLPRSASLGRPFDLGRSAVLASPELFPSTPECPPKLAPLDLCSMLLPPVQELPASMAEDDASPAAAAGSDSDKQTSQHVDSPSSTSAQLNQLALHQAAMQQAAVQQMMFQQAALQQAAMLSYMQMGQRTAAYPLLTSLTAAPVAPAAKAQSSSKDSKPKIAAKPSNTFNEPAPGVPRTTLLFRNMPNNQTRKMFMDILDRAGFQAKYDFLYLPVDFQSRTGMGYAFVNFVNEDVASQAKALFEGFTHWRIPSRKVCGVSWSQPHQGFEAHVQRYRNSPVMHEDVPDTFKPVILKDGQRMPFPAPTHKVKAPRQRPSKANK